jgi:protein phosphatase PTC1
MEDAHTIMVPFDAPNSAFVSVFDGHAGRAAADYAGSNVYKHFQTFLKDHDPPHAYFHAFRKVDEELVQKKGVHSGCTAVCAYIRTEKRNEKEVRVLYTANVGDARAVLSRNGKAVRLSYDHKGSDVNEQRRVQESGGFMMNSRVNGASYLCRGIGRDKIVRRCLYEGMGYWSPLYYRNCFE